MISYLSSSIRLVWWLFSGFFLVTSLVRLVLAAAWAHSGTDLGAGKASGTCHGLSGLRSWDCKSLTVLGLAPSSSVCGPGFKQPGLNAKMCQQPTRSNPWETQVLKISLKSYYSALMSHDNLWGARGSSWAPDLSYFWTTFIIHLICLMLCWTPGLWPDQQCGSGMCCAISLWIRSLRMCTPMGNLGDECHPLSHRVSTSPGGLWGWSRNVLSCTSHGIKIVTWWKSRETSLSLQYPAFCICMGTAMKVPA